MFRSDYRSPDPREPGRAGFDPRDPYQTAHVQAGRGALREPARVERHPVRQEAPGRAAAGREAAGRPAHQPVGPNRPVQGLGLLAAFLLSLVLGTACAVANAFVLSSVTLIFAAGFLIGTVYVAARIRYPDLLWALIIPPIVFAMALGVARLFVSRKSGQDLLSGQLVDLSTVMAHKAPLLLAGESLAVLIVLIRVYVYRRASRWKRSPHGRAA